MSHYLSHIVIRVSKSHGLTTAQPHKICLTLPKILRFVYENKKWCILTSFTVCSSCSTHIMWSSWHFWLFLVQDFRSKVLTAHKNVLFCQEDFYHGLDASRPCSCGHPAEGWLNDHLTEQARTNMSQTGRRPGIAVGNEQHVLKALWSRKYILTLCRGRWVCAVLALFFNISFKKTFTPLCYKYCIYNKEKDVKSNSCYNLQIFTPQNSCFVNLFSYKNLAHRRQCLSRCVRIVAPIQ